MSINRTSYYPNGKHKYYTKNEQLNNAPTILLAHTSLEADSYIQWIEEIKDIDSLERNIYLCNYFPFLKEFFDQIRQSLK